MHALRLLSARVNSVQTDRRARTTASAAVPAAAVAQRVRP